MIFTTEADFRSWFEQNLARFDFDKIILSQEVCPDYVLRMRDGRVVKVEAELFAINFRYHRHDPAKVDYILACYSKADEVDGIPVIALHKLNVWEPAPLPPISPDAPLDALEFKLLARLFSSGGTSIMALGEGPFAGDQAFWIRFPPESIATFPRGADDSILTVLPPKAKEFIKKYHHALLGVGLSARTCEAIQILHRRRLVKQRPLAFLAAMMDGGATDHPAWLPTELYLTDEAVKRHGARLRRYVLRHML